MSEKDNKPKLVAVAMKEPVQIGANRVTEFVAYEPAGQHAGTMQVDSLSLEFGCVSVRSEKFKYPDGAKGSLDELIPLSNVRRMRRG